MYFNDYTNIPKQLHKLFPLLEDNNEVFVAGGCFKDLLSNKMPRDVDLYFKTREKFQEVHHKFLESPTFSIAYETNNCIAFHNNKRKDCLVELITNNFGSPVDILDSFDFTVCKYALVKNGGMFEIIYDENFQFDFEDKRIRIGSYDMIFDPDQTFNRILKYTKYGYTLSTESKQKLFLAIKTRKYEITPVTQKSYP